MTKRKIHLPNRIIGEIIDISLLKEHDLDILIESFDDVIKERISCLSYVEDVTSKIDINDYRCDGIYHLLIGLLHEYEDSKLKKDDFLLEISEIIKLQIEKESKEIDIAKIINFLGKALSSRALRIITKAGEIIRGNTNNFMDEGARIFSDIRPILEDKRKDIFDVELNFACIIHNLNLTYYNKKQKKEEIFISLSSSDLYHLLAIIKRAINKDEMLQNFLNKTKIEIINF